MEPGYVYKLPLDTGHFLKSRTLPKCSLQESIRDHIQLLLTTAYGECRFDPEYGCEIWEHEFEHSQISKIWIDRMSLRIKASLAKYETRLTNIQVQTSITEEEFQKRDQSDKTVGLKKCLKIHVTGSLWSTNEEFYTNGKIYLSPFSAD